MKPSLNKLYKFLKLEAEQGFENRAIIGGLDKMLGPWEADARSEGMAEELVQAVVSRLRDYPRLPPAGRADALDGLWKRLQRETGDKLPDLHTAPKNPPHPAGGGTALPPKVAAPSRPRPPREETHPREAAPPVLPRHPEPRRAPVPDGPAAALNAPVTVLTGVGPKHGATLGRLGIHTLGDMLYYFPRRYDDYSQLKPINRLWYGEEITVIAVVQSVSRRVVRGGRAQFAEAVVSDGSGALRIVLWNPYVAKRMRAGMEVALSGKVEQYLGRLVMVNPEVEELERENLHTNRIVPVYPLTSNITQRWLRKLMHQVVAYWAPRVHDLLPDELRAEAGLEPLATALFQAHFPSSMETLRAARYRLAFDEIFLLQLGVQRQKRAWQDRTARVFEIEEQWLATQLSRLPFALTAAQQRSLAEVRGDLASGRPMNRLLQGDVGSGKTVIAALGIAMAVHQGAQAALMAPTSILAEQHYKTLLKLLPAEAPLPAVEEAQPSSSLAEEIPAEGAPVEESSAEPLAPVDVPVPAGPQPLLPDQIRLMVGATSEAEKREIRAALAAGTIKVIIGTHALLEEAVVFQDLQLVVVDEQHRFGVEQRATLRAKGQNPHLLVMTATPIPRSLALTVYGDLDLSVMDEMPPGRQVVETQVFFPRERERVYRLMRSQIEMGHQAFIIYPLVEENGEQPEAEGEEQAAHQAGRSAVEEHARLQKIIFPQYRLGLLHGRMKPEEKDAVMADFRDGKTQILVSTSVVEVGVDVPNATVMVIEGANRFGLAQLHQFRGRVGRGQDKAYCALVPENPDDAENERLQAMVASNDGFVLAQRDLEQRGPGDFLGTRQAGLPELRLASITDVKLIETARQRAQAVFDRDPDLQLPEHRLLAAALERFWKSERGDIS